MDRRNFLKVLTGVPVVGVATAIAATRDTAAVAATETPAEEASDEKGWVMGTNTDLTGDDFVISYNGKERMRLSANTTAFDF